MNYEYELKKAVAADENDRKLDPESRKEVSAEGKEDANQSNNKEVSLIVQLNDLKEELKMAVDHPTL